MADLSIDKRKFCHFQQANENRLMIKIIFSPLVTEVWEVENGNNKIIEPTLPDGRYDWGVALYVVDKDFCKK